MFLRDSSWKPGTAYLVIGALAWLTAGGPAWAERRAAERDPVAFLERAAKDPRLAIDAAQRDALRGASRRAQASRLLERLAEKEELGEAERAVVRRELAALAGDGPSYAARAPEPVQAVHGYAVSPARDLADLARDLRRATGSDGAIARKKSTPAVLAGAALARFDRAGGDLAAELESIGRALHEGGVDAERLARHDAVVAEVRQRSQAVRARLLAAKSGDVAALAEAAEELEGTTEERPHQPYDPDRPPYVVAEPDGRLPGEPEAAAAATLADRLATPVRKTGEVAPLTALPAASHAPPVAADLAATPDVVITPEIEALAASLGGDPLAIYDWVRNHVEFYPTWGSVQGSQRTLEMGRGNAFDTASLMIALLRASGVPARYVTGQIEVPAARARNWVGGAETAQVAQQLLGQGGIANVGLLDGSGQVAAIRLEHVWVEAWVDNVPSRGAVHREGDTWLPLDPSFKQYWITGPSEVFADVPFDAVYDPSAPPFVVDETVGRITGVDPDAFDAALAAWVEEADAYIVDNGVEQSVQGVLGGRQILPEESTLLAGTLPYGVVQRNTPVAALPSSLRHGVRLRGYRSEIDKALGSASFDVRLSLPEIDSRRLGLRFLPATQADADVIDAARANGATSLPVYLIDVVPVIELDGVELARGGALVMGSPFFVDLTLQEPGRGSTSPYRVVAGDEIVVGVTGNGVGPEVVEKRFASHPVDNAPEYLHQVQLHYWTEADHLGAVAAARRGVHPLRLPSAGLFSSTLSVSYVFGAPRTAVYAGRTMDIQRSFVGAAGADREQVVSWVKQSGLQGSYLEGSVFEQLSRAATGTGRPNGISSVHLLAAAAAQGVPIYRITPANAAAAQPLLQLPAAVESDIASALARGQTVLAPERQLDLGPWRGVGYILQDEQTGGGAYLISGGLAGGGILDCLRELQPVFELILVLLLFILLILLLILLILSFPVSVPAFASAAAVFLAFLVVWRGMGPTTSPSVA
jgi:transglutaminase-like putative cysteine protease